MTAEAIDFGTEEARRRVQDDLLSWFGSVRRDLPWRRHRTLYGTWISEMMLQQTTVATVVPYWERFMARFPDVLALAAAPEEDVLAHWSGLGYYRRARQLHAAAREVAGPREGVMPIDAEGWRSLPGIGPYAAGAIASIGLGLPEAAVDANVRRVLGRWLGEATPRDVEVLAAALVPGDRPGEWNEAVMELGALVCQARRPRCEACPVAGPCRARVAGMVVDHATGAVRAGATAVQAVLVAFVHDGDLWLEPSGGPLVPCEAGIPAARVDFANLHRGLLTLPTTAWFPRPASGALDLAAAVAQGLAANGHGGPCLQVPAGRFRHAITRYRLQVDVVVASAPRRDSGPYPGLPGGNSGRWVPLADAGGLNISQLARKALRYIGDARG